MAVGDLERFVARHLEAEGYQFSVNSTFEWLSGLGPFEPSAASAPGASASAAHDMHAALGGDLLKLQNKRRSPLPVDFDVWATASSGGRRIPALQWRFGFQWGGLKIRSAGIAAGTLTASDQSLR